jgi:arylsulfatase A-like enzyme
MNEKESITRRWFLQGAGAGVLIATGLPSRFARAAQPSSKPNIVFILADDLGYADLSCFGRHDFKTPNVDNLALDGMMLTNAYANSAVCSPTRFGLLSGRYQYRFPGGLQEPINNDKDGFPPGDPTIASLLRDQGYGTVLIGKWHLGLLPKFGPLKNGYDRFYGLYESHADYYTHEAVVPPKGTPDLYEGEVPVTQVGYLTNLLGDRAVEEINGFGKSGQPFFLSLHFNAPHWPWETPDADGKAASDGLTGMLNFDGGSQKTYAGMVRSLDENVGRVLYALDRNGLRDNTIVIFTSDNGGERFSDRWPFTGMKTELLEGGIRVPTVVRWPGRIAAGSQSTQQMMSMDWLPTLLAAAGNTPTVPLDGVNVLPALLGESPELPRKLFWRYHAQNQAAMRDGKWKYLKIKDREFLFDVVEDPLERANLKDRQQDIFARLKGEYEAWNKTMLQYGKNNTSHSLTETGRLAERSF